MLSLAEFMGSPQNLARVKELQKTEAAAKNALDAAKKEADRTQALLDEHAEKVRAHEEKVRKLVADTDELLKRKATLARKLAKMKEAEAL